MMNKTNPPQRPKRAQRSDGRSTRAVVLEAAGKVFAERGLRRSHQQGNLRTGGNERRRRELLLRRQGRPVRGSADRGAPANAEPGGFEPDHHFRGDAGRKAPCVPEAHHPYRHERFRALGDQDIPARTGLALALRAQIHHNGGIPEIPETPGTDTGHHGPSTGFPGDATGNRPCRPPCMGLILFPEKLRTLMLPATAGDAEGLLEACWRICSAAFAPWGNGPVGHLVFGGGGETFSRKFPPLQTSPPPLQRLSSLPNPSLQLSLRRNGLPLLADRQCLESGALKKSASRKCRRRERTRAVLVALKKGGNMFPPFSQWLKDVQEKASKKTPPR